MTYSETALARTIFVDEVADKASSGIDARKKADNIARDIRAGQNVERGRVHGSIMGAAEGADMQKVAEAIEDAGETVGATVGEMKVDDLAPGVVGEAYQGVEGSAVVNVGAAIPPEGAASGSEQIVDEHMIEDIKRHEREHERQARRWTAENVDIGASKPLTRKDISETGSMSVQNSLEWVSGDYRGIYNRVTRQVPAERARDVARTGDLAALGGEIRRKKGLAPSSVVPSS